MQMHNGNDEDFFLCHGLHYYTLVVKSSITIQHHGQGIQGQLCKTLVKQNVIKCDMNIALTISKL